MNEKNLYYLLALTQQKHIGPVLSKRLISYCGSAEEVFKSSKKSLSKIEGIGTMVSSYFSLDSVRDRIEKEIEYIKENNVIVTTIEDESYPFKLKQCEDGPLVLYSDNKLNFNHKKTIAFVGTRNATPYGKNLCNTIINELKDFDPIIISGLAYGIDIHAHKAALDYNLETIGVLAHGVDKTYPAAHSTIAKQMARNGGGVLSEYFSNTKPDRENFPKRNRIVAGIADVTIVVESAIRGGSLITANLANDYNRDVFAIPGRIGDSTSAGCNYLIKNNKAHLFNSTQDFIKMMGWEQTEKENKMIQTQLFIDLNKDEELIIKILRNGKLDIDNLCFKTSLTQSQLSTNLFNLEMNGIIRALPGKVYEVV